MSKSGLQTIRCACLSALAWGLFMLAAACGLGATAAAQTPPYGLIQEATFAPRFASEVHPLWAQRVRRGEFKGVDGLKLAYAAVDVPHEHAAVVLVSGRTETFLKYQEVVADLVRQGYSVYIHDHRGQGFSERLLPEAPQKGHVRRFEDYVDDLQTFIDDVVRSKLPQRRLLVLAHSMGGAVVTRHMERFPATFAAAALSSPMHQPNAKIVVSADSSCDWFKLTGWLFSESWAGFIRRPYSHKPYDERKNIYTHSKARWEMVLQAENEHPQVRLGGPTRGWADEACTASDVLIEQAHLVHTPVLVLQAGEDVAVTPEGQNRFCAALAKGGRRQCETGKPILIPGARHELLIESDAYRIPAMTAILDFFARHR